MYVGGKKARCCIRFGVAIALSFEVTAATAEVRVFGCNFVEKYNSTHARIALARARNIVGSHEAARLYHQYVSLKTECRANLNAKRAVKLSPEIAKLARKY
jgi:hypothetical protein